MDTSYDALVELFASFENFLSRLSIYAGISPTSALTNVLVKIIVELISTLALATKQGDLVSLSWLLRQLVT